MEEQRAAGDSLTNRLVVFVCSKCSCVVLLYCAAGGGGGARRLRRAARTPDEERRTSVGRSAWRPHARHHRLARLVRYVRRQQVLE